MPGLAARRNANHLAPIKTSFNERPQTTASVQDGALANHSANEIKQSRIVEDAPKPAVTPLKPRRSRTSLFDLFSKPNVERARGHHEAIPPMPEIPKEHKSLSRRPSTLSKKPPAPRSVSQEKPSSSAPPEPRSQLKTAKSARSLRSIARKDDTPRSHPFKAPWHPPPLFQAYPQAVMHTSLEAPESSNEKVSPTDKKKSPLPSRDGTGAPTETPVKTHRFFGRMKSRSRLREDYVRAQEPSPSPSARTWSRKVYVLVTSGYLLQYAGDGPFDRLPEKILKFGPESAAFASDAIEGKHWVLEVLHSARSDEFSVQADSKTFLSKLGMQSAFTRRLTSKLLLVFGNAEEMDSWLTGIRNEIGSDMDKVVGRGRQAAEAPSVHRYSSIVRHKRNEADHPSPRLDSSMSSPTVVDSQRASSTVVASASSTTFSTGYSKQFPHNLPPGDTRTFSVISSRSDHPMIGPALKTPGFFERQRSPMTTEFPDASWPGTINENSPYVPCPPTISTLEPRNTLDRKRSTHSLSSKSSNNGAESEGLDFKQKTVQHRHSTANISNRGDTLDVNTASMFMPVPSPALQDFPEPPRRSNTSPNEMESIAESPPRSKAGPSPEEQVISGFDSLNEPKRTPYTRASASFTPGSATLTNGRASKRNSVFARPIPVAPSPQQTTRAQLIDSSNDSSRRTSVRETPSQSRRTSTYQDMATSPASSTPSDRPSQEGASRRPGSLLINPDQTPFLAATRKSPRASVLGVPAVEAQASQRVPIVRPPTIRNASRTRPTAAHFPPPRPPPTMPLPAPPVTN